MKTNFQISPSTEISSTNQNSQPSGRPHVEFIQSSQIELDSWQISGISAIAKARTLSYDSGNGAATQIVNFATGWSAPKGYFSTNIEIFILEGHLQIGCYRLKQHSYTYIPAGVCSGSWEAKSPTVALWMPSATPKFIISQEHKLSTDLYSYIPCIDASALPWSGTITPGFPPGAMRKSLRKDSCTGASTWLLGVLPQWSDTRTEIHPVVEEAYVVMGKIKIPQGNMTPGCYFWRPPHIPHGPFSTDTGAFIFFRSDGHLQTYYIVPD